MMARLAYRNPRLTRRSRAAVAFGRRMAGVPLHPMAITPPVPVPLPDIAATQRLASALADVARAGDTIALWGDLGAGKTEFARAFVRARLGRADEDVPSPTFTLVQTYADGEDEIWHADLYRIADPGEALELGLEDAFGHALVLLEWPGRIVALLPRDRLDITIEFAEAGARRAILTPHASWIERMTDLAP